MGLIYKMYIFVYRVERGTLKRRAVPRIEDISCFLIAWIANKILPSCSTTFLEL